MEPALQGSTPDRPPSIPGPADRTTFFEEQRRHRRATWRLTALCALTVLILGVPLSLLLTPVLYACLLVAAHLARLLAPVPAPVWRAFRSAAGLAVGAIDRLLEGPGTLLSPDLFVAAAVLVLPGALVVMLIWLALRAVFLRAGVGGVLLTLGARPPRPGDLEEQQVQNLVAEMAIAAGIEPPRVMLLDAGVPNAAIVGSSVERTTIVVSRRLLDQLSRDETQGVIGHLVGSAGNGDLRIALTLLSVFQTYGVLRLLLDAPFGPQARGTLRQLWPLARRRGGGADDETELVSHLLVRSAELQGKDDLDRFLDAGPRRQPSRLRQALSTALLPLMFLNVSVKLMTIFSVSLFLGPLLALTWRTRRYLADATAVQLTRNPDGLAGALERLGEAENAIPGAEQAAPLFLAWPRREHRPDPYGIGVAFHPPLARRLRRLRAVGARVAAGQPARWRPRSAREWLLSALLVLVIAPLALFALYLVGFVIVLLVLLNFFFMGVLLMAIHAAFSLLG